MICNVCACEGCVTPCDIPCPPTPTYINLTKLVCSTASKAKADAIKT